MQRGPNDMSRPRKIRAEEERRKLQRSCRPRRNSKKPSLKRSVK